MSFLVQNVVTSMSSGSTPVASQVRVKESPVLAAVAVGCVVIAEGEYVVIATHPDILCCYSDWLRDNMLLKQQTPIYYVVIVTG